MHWLNSFICLAFLINLKVGAENIGKDDSHEMTDISATTLPIALQLSKSQQPVNYEISQSAMDETNEVIEERSNYQGISNDIEVFTDKVGPQMEKQDEEPEAEAEGVEETQPEAEEANEEEGEPEAEATADAVEEPAAEPEAEAEAVPADEPEAEGAPEEPEAEEQPLEEPEPEPEPESEPESEPAGGEEKGDGAPPPDETSDIAEVAVVNDETKMPNDEPAKGEEESPTSHVAEDVTKTIATNVAENQEVSCFTCTSIEDLKCRMKPTKQMPCPKVNEGDAGKHNGCYTLYQIDTNTTMRGCVDELAEEGLKYCLTNDKLCSLCYRNACNNKEAPSKAANMLQFNFCSMLFLNIFSIIIFKRNMTLNH